MTIKASSFTNACLLPFGCQGRLIRSGALGRVKEHLISNLKNASALELFVVLGFCKLLHLKLAACRLATWLDHSGYSLPRACRNLCKYYRQKSASCTRPARSRCQASINLILDADRSSV